MERIPIIVNKYQIWHNQLDILVKDMHSHYHSAGYRTINDILLNTHGLVICDVSVWKSMTRLNIKGYIRKAKNSAVNQGAEHSVFHNVLNRNFTADKPMQKIVTYVTYLQNRGKWYYLACFMTCLIMKSLIMNLVTNLIISSL